MENKIIITECNIKNKCISYKYTISGSWIKYFIDNEFKVEYECEINNVPYSIAIIPILGTLLPLSWLCDGNIYVEEIDSDFIEYLPKIIHAYESMYPNLSFKGNIKYKKVVKNNLINCKKTATMFSGGADATQTLIQHIDEKPTLISIWGADVKVDNVDAWKLVHNFISKVARENDLDVQIIKSTFKKIINEGEISKYTNKMTGYGWWLGFHHSMGMLCLTAPLAYVKKYKYIYIASSHTAKDDEPCASHPDVDNNIRFSNCRIVHDGFEFTRLMKIQNIVNYSKKNNKKINVRVCWESYDGQNCCHCEKCGRTMLELISLGQDPKEFGFNYSKKNVREVMYNLKYGNILLQRNMLKYYLDIQENLKQLTINSKVPFYFNWLINCDLRDIDSYGFRNKSLFRKFVRYLERKGFE